MGKEGRVPIKEGAGAGARARRSRGPDGAVELHSCSQGDFQDRPSVLAHGLAIPRLGWPHYRQLPGKRQPAAYGMSGQATGVRGFESDHPLMPLVGPGAVPACRRGRLRISKIPVEPRNPPPPFPLRVHPGAERRDPRQSHIRAGFWRSAGGGEAAKEAGGGFATPCLLEPPVPTWRPIQPHGPRPERASRHLGARHHLEVQRPRGISRTPERPGTLGL
jgi:hypothetical protein